ncbi:CNTP4 protein, partial [Polypterus senegalus]
MYMFKEPYEMNKNSTTQSSAIYSDITLRKENIAFGFRTTQTPCLLLYVTSSHKEFFAVTLNKNGHLQIKIKLHNSKDAEVFKINFRNLANGQLHKIKIHREAGDLSVQIDHYPREQFSLVADTEFNAIKSIFLGKVFDSDDMDQEISRVNALGFTGCLSAVQFNHIAPLKAALLYSMLSPVIVKGHLAQSTCGAYSSTDPSSIETLHSLSDHPGPIDEGEPIANAIRSDSALIGATQVLYALDSDPNSDVEELLFSSNDKVNLSSGSKTETDNEIESDSDKSKSDTHLVFASLLYFLHF